MPHLIVPFVIRSAVLFLLAAASANALEPTFVDRHAAEGLALDAPTYPRGTQPGKRRFVVKVAVDEKGIPGTADVDARENDAPFVAAIKAAVPQWRFLPAFDPDSCWAKSGTAHVEIEFADEGGKRSVTVGEPLRRKDPAMGVSTGEPGVGKAYGEFMLNFPRAARRAGREASGLLQMRCMPDGKTEIQSVVDVEQGEWLARVVGKNNPQIGCKAQERPYCISLALSFCIDENARQPTASCKAGRARSKALAEEARAASQH